MEQRERLSSYWRIGLLIFGSYYGAVYGLVFDQPQSSSDSSGASTAPSSVAFPAITVTNTSQVETASAGCKSALRVSPIVLCRTLLSEKGAADSGAGVVRVNSSKNLSLIAATASRLGTLSPRAAAPYRSRSSQSLAGLAEAELMMTPTEPLALSIGQLSRPRTLSALEDEPVRSSGSAAARFSPLMVLVETPDTGATN